jgi:glycopeptide antibiotics resistance protein
MIEQQAASQMTVPKNVWWFEVLLYASLTLDALSVAFQDRTPRPDMTERMISINTITAAVLLLLLTFLVWLAAHRRKSWPRWVLTSALVLSSISLTQVVGEKGLQFDSFVDIVSCAMTLGGLYCSFTGDAKDWFDA